MDALKDVQIKAKKKTIVWVIVLLLFLVTKIGGSIYNIFSSDGGFGLAMIFNVILGLTVIGLAFYVIRYAIQRFSDKKPGLIINKLGIIDNAGFVSAGMVFWVDVIEINSSKLLFSECIILKVKKPERYIRNQKPVIRRLWLGFENRFLGSPVNISVSSLNIKYNDLFRIIQQQFLSTQVESRTSELKREKDVIQNEKTELLDSINYAKRIQSALLPSDATIQKNLGESFILYLPKAIVSGDFFWVEAHDNWVFFGACDCTGHGVPGALISIVCNNALNRAIKEYNIKEPAKILDKVSELVEETIGSNVEVKDGMDASICAFNKTTRELFWAGANIPLLITRDTGFYELLEFKPDKQPIGMSENRFPYTNHKIDIVKGDILYLASDGYADQFGGEQGKKLTRKKFKELILKQRNKSLAEQRNNLLNFHNQYKSNGDQIDDILVMGIRIES